MITKPIFLIFTLFLTPQCKLHSQVVVGADLLISRYPHLVQGKRIGLVTNHTAILADGKHLVDALHSHRTTELVALFSPEHGIRGEALAGEPVQTETDRKTGIPIYSLYGKTQKPTPKMLQDIDIIIFDIQDVGARFYTYISTMAYVLEAAAEARIPVIVLDRPNPLGGVNVDGFVLEESQRSFVGLHPIPILHGMTVGELAQMMNGEGWLRNGVRADLTVIKMERWKRGLRFDESGLQWIRPSPNMMTLQTASVYPGTCLFEGTNVSEGRGTDHPFEIIGAPFIENERWADLLNSYALPGVRFRPVTFIPQDIPNVALNPKFEDQLCRGISIEVRDPKEYEPVRVGVYLLATARLVSGENFKWIPASIDRLAGTKRLREMIDRGVSPEEIVKSWKKEVEGFQHVRSKYSLY